MAIDTIDEATGEIYLVQSALQCGRHVTVRRLPLGSSVSTAIAAFPRGIDVGWTLALAPTADGHQDLYYERYPCRSGNGDVFALRSVDTL